MVETVDQNGNLLTKFAQGPNIDEPLAESVGGATYDCEQDGLGSATSLTNSAGALAQTYTFDSFGKLTNFSGSIANPFRYTGRDFDSETGLYYYRARYYDPQAGRFLSEDPSDFDGGINFYAYVGNDPADWLDPLGLAQLSLGDIANLVAKHNRSGQTNELIICLAYKESNFDPGAMQSGVQSARGLLGVTDGAATSAGYNWDDLGDPALNIDAGSKYLGMRIHWAHGSVWNGLWGYGTHTKFYVNSLLQCEKCLISHIAAKATDECKTKDCLEPLHPPKKPKTPPRPKPRIPRKPTP